MILSHEQTQQQILSVAMQQSLAILQMSLPALQAHLNEVSVENPMIDLVQPKADPADAQPLSTSWRSDLSGRRFERERLAAQHSKDDVPLEIADDYELQETFVSHLKKQLPQLAHYLPEQYLSMCEFIIESLDRRGYLDEPIDLLAAAMGASIEDAVQALYAVQTLTPTGVGARTLEECLLLQLAESHDFNRYTLSIVREHLMLLANNDFASLAKVLRLPQNEVRAYCQVIRGLNPIPSNGFRAHQDDNHYIIPDAIVEFQGNEVIVHYNQRVLPRIRINKTYQSILASTDDPEVKDYLNQNLQQLHRLQQHLDRRESTLVRLIQYVLGIQKDYVLGLTAAPAALSIRKIADALDLHPSTISRAVKDKYITIAGRTIALKNLLSAQIGNGIPASKAMLDLYIRRLIHAEDKAHPLSDEALCAALAAMDIHISRRTVAAYRDKLNIPSTSKRRVR